jgi:choline kinase
MDAIIYAAGRALRLGLASGATPKILLTFGVESLLERHVRLLGSAGIRRVHVVTGHLRERVAAVLPRLGDEAGVEVREIVNPDYSEGSLLSMQVSLPAVRASEGGVLIMDGDVLYDQRILERWLGSSHPSVLLVDRGYSTADDDPVLVPIREGRPFEFRKGWSGDADWVGESVGFFRLTAEDAQVMAVDTEARVAKGRRGDSYDEVLRSLVCAGRMGAEDVTGVPWTEVDFEEDIVFGRETIWPQLQALPERAGRK